MRWPEDATDWPLTEHSRIVSCAPHRWHLQDLGSGPALLLLHGAGGATQSWRNLAPLLALDYRVICVDLPGQGFTQVGAKNRYGLDATAQDLMALCQAEEIVPHTIIGHSAGAAIALRMVQLGMTPDKVIGINAALGEFKGVAGLLFPAMAKALAAVPFAASTFAQSATSARVNRLLESTGSVSDEAGKRLYLRLVKDKAHVDATLSMMAQWNLKPLLSTLSEIDVPVHLITGENDTTVPPRVSREAATRLPRAEVHSLKGLGHLAHEEDAEAVADLIRELII